MLGVVYTAENQRNGKCYVGQTRQSLAHRWKKHIEVAQRQPNTLFTRAIRKHGPQAFFVTAVAECETKAELDRKETLFIIALRAADPKFGYNCTFGGDGVTATDEVKAKLRAKFLGRAIPQEQRDRISATLKGNTNKTGKKISESARASLRALTGERASMFGRKHNQESKKRTSEKMLGNKNRLGLKNSPEHRQAISDGWARRRKRLAQEKLS